MKRRTFVELAGVAALAPLAALAQPAGRVPLVGVLIISNPEPFLGMLREGLRAQGYAEGKNIRLEVRNAEGDSARLPGLAAELVQMKVDVLVASQTPAVHAAAKATKAIPIAMMAGDPVGTGVVTNLARPSGNITGISSTTAELGGKLLELLRELNPRVKRVGVLSNRNDPFTKPFIRQIEEAGARSGIDISTVGVAGPPEYEAAYATLLKTRVEAVILQPSLPRKDAIALAIRHKLPPISPTVLSVEDGVLIGYSARFADVYPAVAVYVDKLLKGAKPADLPIQQPTVFELAVNQKTAKALGITIPRSILARADRVIE